jgi:hypothetical protein
VLGIWYRKFYDTNDWKNRTKIISLLADESVIVLLFYDSVLDLTDFLVGASSVKRYDAPNWKETL